MCRGTNVLGGSLNDTHTSRAQRVTMYHHPKVQEQQWLPNLNESRVYALGPLTKCAQTHCCCPLPLSPSVLPYTYRVYSEYTHTHLRNNVVVVLPLLQVVCHDPSGSGTTAIARSDNRPTLAGGLPYPVARDRSNHQSTCISIDTRTQTVAGSD